MKNKNKQRRFFLKSLLGLGAFSIFPFKLTAFNALEECITTSDIQGPYYIPDSPNISILNPPEITSNFLFITGTVYANDCITPIPNATVDVWHSNKGTYDLETNSYLNSSYDNVLYRAKIYTDKIDSVRVIVNFFIIFRVCPHVKRSDSSCCSSLKHRVCHS